MSDQPVNVFNGMRLDEWMQAVPNGLDDDGISLWQIIASLRKGFGLQGQAVERAARQVIRGLLDRGARPVVTASPENGFWREITCYGKTQAEIIDNVIAEWHRMGRDPHHGDLWFAHPDLYAPAAPAERR